jgi:hypothetical protein
MTKDEALKMAIEEIEGWIDHAYGHSPEECADNKTIMACKEALKQPAQECKWCKSREVNFEDWGDELRTDIIGQNGNDGLHYEEIKGETK